MGNQMGIADGDAAGHANAMHGKTHCASLLLTADD